jgi:hypothetical protein
MIDRPWHGCCGNDNERREVDEMKNAKSFLLAAILGSIAAMSPVLPGSVARNSRNPQEIRRGARRNLKI